MTAGVALYSAVDDILTHYEVDVETATLTRKSSIRMPAKVQYAWPHPSSPHLYVSSSSGGPRVPSSDNFLSAFAIGADGALTPQGDSARLSRRAVHMCIDPTGRFALNGHNFPASGITAQDGKAEEPGAMRSYGFSDGNLSAGQVVAPNGGYGFGARHVDFHPSLPCLYVSDERTNRLYMFRCPNDEMEAEPAFTRDTLAEPANRRPRQIAGPIHVHPDGRCVYVANRADHGIEQNGAKVFGGGENNIAVYAIDPNTGEPTLVQHADTHSFHVRTFACDPSGRLLVAASIKPHVVLEVGEVVPVPAALSVFRIGDDGQLSFVRKYDVTTTGGQMQYWMGMVGLK
jgi:6-phosphogluconolactonase